MKATRVLSRTFTNRFDMDGTLNSQSLSKAHPEPLRRIARGVLAGIGISLCFMPLAGSTSANKEYIDFKTYALYLLDWNKEQHICLLKLYGKESAWNPAASNGSHYGIPQGNSEWLRTQDGYSQVRWGLDYIGNRYGEPCIALDHWRRFNWH
jgi:hypothetical protein